MEIFEGAFAKAVKSERHNFFEGEEIEFTGKTYENMDEGTIYNFKSVERTLDQDLSEKEFILE